MTSAPALAVVSGSGLDLTGLLDQVDEERAFGDVPGLSESTVAGHQGRYVLGSLSGVPLILQCGRRHFYEGCDYAAVTATVDALAGFGARRVIFTNAAGGLRPEMEPGDLMAAESVLVRPYAGWPNAPEALKPPLQIPGTGHTGCYVWLHGPCYETRAEIHALQCLGGGAVGMSTAPELARCAELGIPAGVVSCITNNCCRPAHLTHKHVVDTAQHASARLVTLIRDAIPVLLKGF